MSRYSKLALPRAELLKEAIELQTFLKALEEYFSSIRAGLEALQLWTDLEVAHVCRPEPRNSNITTPAQLVAIYVLIFQIKRIGPGQCLQNMLPLIERNPNSKPTKDKVISLVEEILTISSSAEKTSESMDIKKCIQNLICELAPLVRPLFDEFQLSKIPGEVSFILKEWLNNRIELEVVEFVPTPQQVLKLQAQNRRMVSVFFDVEMHKDFILEKSDAYEFCLHDLSHGAKFLLSPHRADQVRFFKRLDQWLNCENILEKNLPHDLRHGIYYVMSDMNSHSDHLLQTLVAHLKIYGMSFDSTSWQSTNKV